MRFTKAKRKRQKLGRPNTDPKDKNYFFSFLLAILFWATTTATILWTAPSALTIPIFFITLSLALLITFSVLFANTRRGMLATLVIVLFLLLRLIKLGNILNLALLVGAALSFELYRRG